MLRLAADKAGVMAGPSLASKIATPDRAGSPEAVSGHLAQKLSTKRREHSKPPLIAFWFPGVGRRGLRMLREAADKCKLLVVSEVMEQARFHCW